MKSFFSVSLLLFILLQAASCENATVSSAPPLADNKNLTEKEIKDIDAVVECYITTGKPSQLYEYIKRSNCQQRRELLDRPIVWSCMSSNRWWEYIVLVVVPVIITLLFTYCRRIKKERDNISKATKPHNKTSIFSLLARDISLLCFSSSVTPTSCEENSYPSRVLYSEYGGFVHWLRDIIEKILSFGLIVIFYVFLYRGLKYFYYYICGKTWQLAFLPIDINIALTTLGFSLIIDGFIQVSSMTDAPGIRRTLDAVIVTLAGSLIMLLEAKPSYSASISFSLGATNNWLCIGLASAIAMLFLVRWIVRHHTVSDFLGKKSRDRVILR